MSVPTKGVEEETEEEEEVRMGVVMLWRE